MQVQIAVRHSTKLLFAAICIFAVACTQKWYMTIDPGTGLKPAFCFSTNPNCGGDGVQFAALEVAEVDAAGDRRSIMWLIQPKADLQDGRTLKKVAYGSLPSGWILVTQPIPLKPGTYYGVNGQYFFSYAPSGEVTVLDGEEFAKHVAKKPG